MRTLSIVLMVTLGVLIGLGSYTFVYARGYSYLSDDPEVCVNCHIMRENYDSWVVSSHRTVSCNGCHTPHEPVTKYLVKAENGFAHSFAFTFFDPQIITIRDRSLEVVESNCIDCHQPMVAPTFLLEDGEGPRNCTHCHRATGHAPR